MESTRIEFNNNFPEINNKFNDLINNSLNNITVTNIIPEVFCNHYGVDVCENYKPSDLKIHEIRLYGEFKYDNIEFGIWCNLYKGEVIVYKLDLTERNE